MRDTILLPGSAANKSALKKRAAYVPPAPPKPKAAMMTAKKAKPKKDERGA